MTDHPDELTPEIEARFTELFSHLGTPEIPVELQDDSFLAGVYDMALAAESAAASEARARLAKAEGEQKAAAVLAEAAAALGNSPGALQLRFLQTLSALASNGNAKTIVIPFPSELLSRTAASAAAGAGGGGGSS